MIWFLIKNYFSLRTFMDIKINPFSDIQWEVGYKIPYNKLNDEQKKLSNEFTRILKRLDFG